MRNQEFSCSTRRNTALSPHGSVGEAGVLNTAAEREGACVCVECGGVKTYGMHRRSMASIDTGSVSNPSELST